MSDNKKSSLFGIGLVVGTVLGGLAAFFFNPKTGRENREALAVEIKKLEKLLKDKDVDEKVKAIFGEASHEAKVIYLKVKKDLIEKLAQLKEGWEKIDKEKYLEIVADVTREAKKETKYTEKILERLHQNLVGDWEKINK